MKVHSGTFLEMLLFLTWAFPIIVCCQENKFPGYIEGKIFDGITEEPVSFATIYNKTTRGGTISNAEGYFRLSVNSDKDSVIVSIVGYHHYVFRTGSGRSFYEIHLEPAVQQLKAVTIVADGSYLYRLLNECRNVRRTTRKSGRAYYELRSFSDSIQVELLECLYNADVQNYDLQNLEMKAGRFALRENDGRLFVSLESSKAITMHSMFIADAYFPKSPLELPLKKLNESYRLRLQKKILHEKDSVYVVECLPRDTTGFYFNTTVWINPSNKNILRVDHRCRNAQAHPFLPLQNSDSILNVDMYISKKFLKEGKRMVFSHIDFFYDINYRGLTKNYSVSTKAMLYIYDGERKFHPPLFSYTYPVSDYQKINAIPFNSLLWTEKEMSMNYRAGENNRFFDDPRSLTSKTIFSPGQNQTRHLLKYPYVFWSANRIGFGKYLVDKTTSNPTDGIFTSSFYNLSAKILLDINSVDDSVLVTSATILDPFESYYRLNIDNAALCFINIYFDLIEIARRDLETQIQRSPRTPEMIVRLYEESRKEIERITHRYNSETQRGTNMYKLAQWNNIVFERLGINNMGIFGLTE